MDGSDMFWVFSSSSFFWPPPYLFQAGLTGGQQSGAKQHRPGSPYSIAVVLRLIKMLDSVSFYTLSGNIPAKQNKHYVTVVVSIYRSVQRRQYRRVSTAWSVQTGQYNVVSTDESVRRGQYRPVSVVNTDQSVQRRQYRRVSTAWSVQTGQRGQYRPVSTTSSVQMSQYRPVSTTSSV